MWVKGVLEGVNIFSSNAPISNYLDPIYTLYQLAALNFEPSGTKLAFSGHAIHFCSPTLQGITRTAQNCWSGGANSEALINLLPGIYYGLRELDPYKKPYTRLFCLLAWRGVALLEQTYENDMITALLLRNCHLSLFEDAFNGQITHAASYKIPDLSNDPLYITSQRYWGDQNENHFSTIHRGLIAKLKKKFHFENQKESQSREIQAISDCFFSLDKNFSETEERIRSNQGTPAPLDKIKDQLSKEQYENQLEVRFRTIFQLQFWPWFQNDFGRVEANAEGPFCPHNVEQRLESSGVSINKGADHLTNQLQLWEWLQLPAPPYLEQDIRREREALNQGKVGSAPGSRQWKKLSGASSNPQFMDSSLKGSFANANWWDMSQGDYSNNNNNSNSETKGFEIDLKELKMEDTIQLLNNYPDSSDSSDDSDLQFQMEGFGK